MVVVMTASTPATPHFDGPADSDILQDDNSDPGRNKRPNLSPTRSCRLNPRFTPDELAEVKAAAASVGTTATGFCADSAVSAARGTPLSVAATQDREELKRLQRQLFAARTAVNRFGTNVNQIATVLNATGEAPEWMGRAMALVGQSIRRLDEVIAEVHRKLR